MSVPWDVVLVDALALLAIVAVARWFRLFDRR